MKAFFLLFVCFFLVSCSSRNEAEIDLDLHDFQIKFESVLNIRTESPIKSSFQVHQVYEDSLFYGLNPFEEPNVLYVFDLKNEVFVKKIVLDQNLFKVDMMNFLVHRPDSIFFHAFSTKDVYLVNGNGDQIGHWDLDKAQGVNYPGEFGYFLPFSIYHKFYYENEWGHLVLPISDNYFHEERGDSELPKVLIFDIYKNEIVRFIAPPSGRMANRGSASFPGDILIPQILIHNGFLYISYPFDDEINVFELSTGELTLSKNPLNGRELGLYEPKSPEIMSDRSKSWQFRSEMPFFENLSFHPQLELFSRIYQHPYHSEKDPEKTYVRKSTIVYFDKNLYFKGKQDFVPGELGVYKNSSMNKGYLSSKSDFFIESDEFLNHKQIVKFEEL
ncbi:hypothetical protein [Cecembia lonarensis]|uniref:DUF4221 domain-containing protein n=1 Tax=Cecembia lonarensis (strain CCUG 58316 / KCTC 22772 / LW9) TaxID=1225176 RepID=K1LKR5_CECL9|nr:hypothetical protein [Cecembia lonarensis]EKB50983.1 hypothetical protein B879_00270 [Cecembia lonarensis LW9]